MNIYIVLILIIFGIFFWVAKLKIEDISNPEKGVTNCDKRISEIKKIKTRKMYSNIER